MKFSKKNLFLIISPLVILNFALIFNILGVHRAETNSDICLGTDTVKSIPEMDLVTERVVCENCEEENEGRVLFEYYGSEAKCDKNALTEEEYQKCRAKYPYGGPGTFRAGDNYVLRNADTFAFEGFDASGYHWMMTDDEELVGNAMGFFEGGERTIVSDGKFCEVTCDGRDECTDEELPGDFFAKASQYTPYIPKTEYDTMLVVPSIFYSKDLEKLEIPEGTSVKRRVFLPPGTEKIAINATFEPGAEAYVVASYNQPNDLNIIREEYPTWDTMSGAGLKMDLKALMECSSNMVSPASGGVAKMFGEITLSAKITENTAGWLYFDFSTFDDSELLYFKTSITVDNKVFKKWHESIVDWQGEVNQNYNWGDCPNDPTAFGCGDDISYRTVQTERSVWFGNSIIADRDINTKSVNLADKHTIGLGGGQMQTSDDVWEPVNSVKFANIISYDKGVCGSCKDSCSSGYAGANYRFKTDTAVKVDGLLKVDGEIRIGRIPGCVGLSHCYLFPQYKVEEIQNWDLMHSIPANPLKNRQEEFIAHSCTNFGACESEFEGGCYPQPYPHYSNP